MNNDIFSIVEAYDKEIFQNLVQTKLEDGWRLINCTTSCTQDKTGDVVIFIYTAFLIL